MVVTMPLQLTDHPTNPNEFYAVYARAVFDVLSTQDIYSKVAKGKKGFALYVQRLSIERSLIEIGYFKQGDVWIFRQQGYEGFLPSGWTKLPVENFAQKISDAGVNMLNERSRRPDVQKVERI